MTTILLFASCSSIDYDNNYSKDGFYNANNSVYFSFKTKADSLITYSFGPKWVEYKRDTVKVPVKVTGFATKKDRVFKVIVDEKESTAIADRNYTPLSENFIIPADSLSGNINVIIWRDNLRSDSLVSIKIVLRLKATTDLDTNFGDNDKVTISYNNYLEEPYYWVYYEYNWGPFSKIKYQKFLEYYNGDPLKMYNALTSDFNGLSMNFIKVYDFFKAHPEYNQVLPTYLYRPYK